MLIFSAVVFVFLQWCKVVDPFPRVFVYNVMRVIATMLNSDTRGYRSARAAVVCLSALVERFSCAKLNISDVLMGSFTLAW